MEFVNADNIAAGISPFNPESVYKVTLLFMWLNSPATAMQRVADRVAKGSHNIPADVIERRYYRGIFNLIHLYIPICDRWMLVDNETVTPKPICEGGVDIDNIIINSYIWDIINEQAKRDGV